MSIGKMKNVAGIFLLILSSLFAQNTNLTLQDAALKWRTELAPKRLKQLQWIADEDRFSYVEDIDSVATLFVGRGNNGKTRAVLKLMDLNRWLTVAGIGEMKRFPAVHWMDAHRFWFWKGDSMLISNLKKKSVTVHTFFSGKHAHPDVAKKSLAIAFTRGNNLYLLLEGGKEIAVTRDSLVGIVNGQTVHRSEFGIYKGTFWSPENHYLAFYRKDERMVTDYPYVDFTTRPAQAKPAKYPMAGMKNHIVSIGIYDIRTGTTTWLQTGEPKDQYLTNLTWSPDEKYLYVAHVNRDQNHMRLIQYDVATGKAVNTLFEETDAKYTEPLTGLFFIHKDPRRFLWLSRRDGWNHLYLYRSDGQLMKQLTKGEWEITRVHGFDKNGANVFFTAAKESPIHRDLYRVNLRNGKLTRLSSGNGTHRVALSSSGKFFLDIFTNLTNPGITTLFSTSGKQIRNLLTSPNPLKGYRIGRGSILPLEMKDGTVLYSRLILPPDFDPARRYPLIVYVYGGPHSQLVRDTWLGGYGSWMLWLYYLANQGYVVFTVDNHGTSYRGKAFEQATFRHLGTVEINDQLAALKQLIQTHPYIDTTRIGVIGWSYGGFMATSLKLRAPEVFKAAIGGAPVIDWKYYETVYTERYMDTPETNPDGYKESSTLSYVDSLKGKLFLIQGTSDNVVMWQHTILFVNAAIKAGKQLDYFIYPGHKHGIVGKDRFHLLQRMTMWFEKNL